MCQQKDNLNNFNDVSHFLYILLAFKHVPVQSIVDGRSGGISGSSNNADGAPVISTNQQFAN